MGALMEWLTEEVEREQARLEMLEAWYAMYRMQGKTHSMAVLMAARIVRAIEADEIEE